MRLLEVSDLTVSFPTADGIVHAVRGLSFGVDPGRTLGIVGESGSGKSVAALTLVRLTRGAEVAGTALFAGRDLLTLPEDEMRQVRGARIAMVFQDPLSSLHPQYRIGWQIAEMVRAHQRASRRVAHRRAVELLGLVGIPQPDRRVDDYPHQFSGGMRQRVMIAMALALDPALLIADEPTTALDATVRAQILDLLIGLQRELGTALIMISHDLGVIAEVADDVLVMYAGKIVESASVDALFADPQHPYTIGLLGSIPRLDVDRERLATIEGTVPSPNNQPAGCRFAPRCPFADRRCHEEPPPLRELGAGHLVACWKAPVELARVAA
jgi:peptide/nickel transport system ATP-binding protein/oligopeptide transport system ATP-binding protein